MRTSLPWYPRELPPYQAGLYTGMTDSIAPAASRNDRARVLLNAYVPPGPPGTPVVGRPGFTYRGLTGDAAMGSGAAVGQAIFFWKTTAGVGHLNAIVDGIIYEYDFATSLWASVVTQANITSASCILSVSARIRTASYQGVIIISDGINVPFTWDGTAGAGAIVEGTNVPVTYGEPLNHYAKAFVIKGTERDTFAWSEEAAFNTGYEAGGYNNSWTPLGAGPFYALAATNEALYAFRSRGILSITGRVNDEFQTTGTRSSVSESEGTLSPVKVTDAGIFFVNADGQPHYFQPGGQPIPLWEDCKETIKNVVKTALPSAAILEYTPMSAVLIGLPELGQTNPSMWLVYRIDKQSGTIPDLGGVFTGFLSADSCIAENASGAPVWFHLGIADGFAYEHGAPDGQVWDDVYPTATLAIIHEVQGHPWGPSMVAEKTWDRVDIVLSLPEPITADSSYVTPRGTSTPISVGFEGAGGTLYNTKAYDTFFYADDSLIESRQTVGISGHGRWLQPILRHSALGERFSFTSWEAVALLTTRDRTVK